MSIFNYYEFEKSSGTRSEIIKIKVKISNIPACNAKDFLQKKLSLKYMRRIYDQIVTMNFEETLTSRIVFLDNLHPSMTLMIKGL